MAGFPASVPDVEIYAGDTAEWPPFTFTTDGTPIDLTDWDDWTATWRPTPGSADSVDLDVDTTAGATGTVKITASATATRAMQNLAPKVFDGFGYWDLQAVNGAVVRTWLRGKTINREDVTR